MTTLKEFEDALREQGMLRALAVLETLRKRDRARRTVTPARRITGRKMTPELARLILEMHETTKMTQQEIAFKVGVNQGRVNEVIKRGKWLSDDPQSPEAVARDKALQRAAKEATKKRLKSVRLPARDADAKGRAPKRGKGEKAQLSLGDF